MERPNLDDYLVYLFTKDTVDAHTYDKEPDDEDNYVQPDRLPSVTAIGKFRDRDYGLVNFLNSSVRKQNEILSCIAGLPAYSILRDTREYDQSGKQTEAQPFDLSACVSYQICGKGGVFSYPHIDHHSLLNTAFVDNGEKLWPLWGRLSDAGFAQWATSDGIAPEPAPFTMYLQEGDLFVQRA